MTPFSVGKIQIAVCVLSVLVVLSNSKHDNFCKPLEDYGPREDSMETRHVCNTEMKKNCRPITEQGCLNVTELQCTVKLTTNCTMDWQNKEKVQSVMSVQEKNLKNCTKAMVREFHNKTVYDCKNVTKVHCTTLWTMDESGQKVWAGNEDDCKDVTWEECYPISKQVPMLVAEMNCRDVPVSYFDYENSTSKVMADVMDCKVTPIPVCEPVVTTKCDEVTYTRCEEIPETVCSSVDIPVPSQKRLHKQWCLFDQQDNIDFDRQVRKIAAKQAGSSNDTLSDLLDDLTTDTTLLPFGSDFDPIFFNFSERLTASAPALDIRSSRGTGHHTPGKKQKRFAKTVKLVRKKKTVAEE